MRFRFQTRHAAVDQRRVSRAQPARSVLTRAVREAWKKIRYRLEWLALKSATKFLPLLSREACYRLALCSARLAPCSIAGAGALR